MNDIPIEESLGDSITAHMRSDFASLRIGQTVGEALTSIREKSPGGRIISI